jgi:hypothetical protein
LCQAFSRIMDVEKVFIRYYNHDLYPGLSGIALSLNNGESWEIVAKKFSEKTLEDLKKKHPKAAILRTPLRDESF